MALTPAEKQRRYRERRKAGIPAVHTRKPRDRRSRAQRWRDAVAELGTLQEHYRDCLDRLPESLIDTALRRTPADHRRGRDRGPRGDRTTTRLRTGHMTPGTLLNTVTLPCLRASGSPMTTPTGNVTTIKGRHPAHAAGITGCTLPRLQGTNIGNAERRTGCGQSQETSSRKPQKTLPRNMDAAVVQGSCHRGHHAP